MAPVLGTSLVLTVVLTLAPWVRSAATLLLIGVMIDVVYTAASGICC